MNVLYLASTLAPHRGWGRLAGELIRALQAQGIEATVLTGTGPEAGPDGADVLPLLTSGGMGPLKPLRVLRDVRRARRALEGRRFDLVHAVTEDTFPVAAALADDAPLVLHAAGTYAVWPLERLTLRRLYRRAYERADRVICISGYTERVLRRYVPGAPTVVVPLGTSLGGGMPTDDRGPTTDDTARLVLTVGAVKRRKGMDVALEAMARVMEDRPDVVWEIVGPGKPSLVEPLEARAAELGIADRVRWLGKVDEATLRAKYRECDVFLLTPVNYGIEFEGFGLVYIEANAFGKPVVGTRDCGAEEAITDGYNGLLVPQQDPAATAEAVAKLLDDPALAAELGRHGIERARELSWKNVTRRVVEEYAKLVDGPETRAPRDVIGHRSSVVGRGEQSEPQ